VRTVRTGRVPNLLATPKPEISISWVDPKALKAPDVRITSVWDPELLEMFKKSVEAEGIQQPLIVVKEGENLWIVDGLHRRDEALLKGIEKVPCVVFTGTMRQVMTKNLYMNRLRGGVKASEMIKVINWLSAHEGMNSEAIQRETGLNRDYIEKVQQVGKAVPEVLEALDKEEIGVGHAFEIARIKERDVQLRLLAQIFQYRLTVKDLHQVVEDTLEIIRIREQQGPPDPNQRPVLVPKIRCHACEEEYPLKKVTGVNLCINCYGLLMDAIKQARKKGDMAPSTEEENRKSQDEVNPSLPTPP
jgi:ParB family chromosome partitioning protein